MSTLVCQGDMFPPFRRSYNMRSSSGDARLANRLHVLQLRMLEPALGVNALAKRAGLTESTVRSILKRYGGSSIATGAPTAKKGAGRPGVATNRDKRYALIVFSTRIDVLFPQAFVLPCSKASPLVCTTSCGSII